MMPFRVLPEARAELLHEVEYYSEVRSGAGVRVQAAVENGVALARAHPQGGAPAFKSVRSVRVKGFPFSVVYVIEDDVLVVVAIAPHRKRPLYWLARSV